MLRVICWIVLVSAVLTAEAGAARADEVGLSLDGRTWTPDLDRPLFDPRMRWVPGDVEIRSFWVRNESATKASMNVGVRTSDPDALLSQDDFLVDARVRGGTWVALPRNGGGLTLTDRTLPASGRIRIDLRVTFDATSENRTQVASLPMRFVVRLTQAGPRGDAPGGGPGTTPDGPDGLLPGTGAAAEPWQLWLAGALLGGGLLILAARRRKEHADA